MFYCRWVTPAKYGLAVHELDTDVHVGKVSFHSREGILQVGDSMCQDTL